MAYRNFLSYSDRVVPDYFKKVNADATTWAEEARDASARLHGRATD